MGSARGLECGRVVDCAWTVEPAKPVAVPGVDLGECVNPAELGEPTPLVEAGRVAATTHTGGWRFFLAMGLCWTCWGFWILHCSSALARHC